MQTNHYFIMFIFERRASQICRWRACFLMVLLWVFGGYAGYATNYFLASNGDDAKDGKSAATAWKTITFLNTKMSGLQPGDSVLFHRGDTFVGQLTIGKSGNASKKIIFSAYGNGAAPVITGAVQLGQPVADQSSAWTPYRDGIWRCYYKTGASRIVQLAVNGDRKWIARYPNEGYFFADTTGTRNSLIEYNLGKAASYFTGSYAAVRWIQDAWTNLAVSGVTTGATKSTVTFASSVRDPIKKFSGYYFYGNLPMLDAPDEWYFNDAVDSIYYMPPAGVDPNTLNIEGSLYDYNINTNGSDFLCISNLKLIRAAHSGVLMQGSDNVVFDKLTVQESYYRGFFSGNGAGPQYVTTNCQISNCTITDCSMGVLLWRTSNTSVTGNVIKRIGLRFPGFAQSYSADGLQTDINCKLNRYAYNRIDSTSKNGICINDSASIVERNILTNMGFHTADLGGIYTGGNNTYGLIVRNNFMYNFRTNNESWGEPLPDSYRYLNPGIYNDRRGIGNTWKQNTIFNTGMGAQHLNETGSTMEKNVVYGIRRGGMNFVESGVTAGSTGNHRLSGNVIYKNVNESTTLMALGSNTPNWFHYIAHSDSNYFYSAYRPDPIGSYSYKLNDTTTRYENVTLASWRSKLGDATSRITPFVASSSAPDQSRLLINPGDNALTVPLSADTAWFNLDSTRIYNSVVIEPWYSRVLVGIPLPKPPTPIIRISPDRTVLTRGTSDTLTLEVTNCPGRVIWKGGTGYGPDNRFLDLLPSQAVGTYTFCAVCQPDTRAGDSASVTLEVVAPTLMVQLKDGDNGQASNNQLAPNLQVSNTGAAAVPLSELSVRYWFTAENYAPINTYLDWAQVGTGNVKLGYVRIDEPRQGADGYVEYRFEAAAGSLATNAMTGPIQSRIAKNSWTPFNESDDYSYNATSSYTETGKVTLYRTGADGVPVLIWGKEPARLSRQVSLQVESENKNSLTNSNTIRTYLKVNNTGNVAVACKDLRVRYWFTAEGSQLLNYWVDWAQLGAANIKSQVVRLSPTRTGADTYLEISVDSTLGSLPAHSSTNNIQYRISKTDWSLLEESDDHSWKASGPMAVNEKITVYYKGQLVFGTEPVVPSSSRTGLTSEEVFEPAAYPNPAREEIYLKGGTGPVHVRLRDVAGQEVLNVKSRFGKGIGLKDLAPGIYILQADSEQGRQVHKIIKQ